MYIYRSTITVADKLDFEYGFKLPEVNAPALLWRLTANLGGTRELLEPLRVNFAHIALQPATTASPTRFFAIATSP